MGEIADAIIEGEFDCITGEYLGDPTGFPRSCYHHKRQKNYLPTNKKMSVETRTITDMCNRFGVDERRKIELIAKFLRTMGIIQLPSLNRQYKIIYHKYRKDFEEYVKAMK